MNRNYSNVDKKKWSIMPTFMSIMHMTKVTLDMWMWGPFYNKSGVTVSWESVRANNYVQMYKIL